jgi:hypothetical protein
MALTPGLSPSIRLDDTPQDDHQAVPLQASDIVIDDDPAPDGAQYNDNGDLIKIEHGDGSITITLDGSPLERAEDAGPQSWYDNLVDKIDSMELSSIAEDLLRGIRDDEQSRTDLLEMLADGIKLLGLKPELPSLGGSADGAPVEGISRVRHPLLLEAVLRFQANARSELLPTDGPVKVRDDNSNQNIGEDQLANALETDLNHYLTSTATEYYPDTDRMLLMLGFGGTAFKKVYYCPLRNRPVSETVDINDLIVNSAASDLRNAKRVTHKIMMKPSMVKRMQILGVYRDVDLSTPQMPKDDAVKLEQKAQEGISPSVTNPDDRDREIYECYCELNIPGYEHKWKNKETGLEIPYRVTLDASSKEVLSVVRNYAEDDKELPEAEMPFVQYTFIPGFEFYGIGLLHILGNTTNAITAAWRELLDAGMYSTFPGFLMADTGARQNTNIFRVPPGGGALIKTDRARLSDAVMPLPYKEPSQALMALVSDMATTGMRIGGTSEQQVGEGRADAPVGTTLAMIEQATKVLNAVHKRLHASQAEEFRLLVEVFKSHPESFWQRNKSSAYEWDEKTFLRALNDCDLVPQADPNTASHTQRVMKIMALKQLQAASPQLYDPVAIDKAALAAIGFSNPDQFMTSPQQQEQLPPAMQKEIATLDIKKQEADAKTMKAQADAAKAQAQAAHLQMSGEDGGLAQAKLQIDAINARTKSKQVEFQNQRSAVEDQNRDRDRAADLEIEKMKLEAEQIRQGDEHRHDMTMEALRGDARAAKAAKPMGVTPNE